MDRKRLNKVIGGQLKSLQIPPVFKRIPGSLRLSCGKIYGVEGPKFNRANVIKDNILNCENN
jgi:hypothetical protein